jgi:hypothetical protein
MVYDGIVIGLIVGFIRAGLFNGLLALTKIQIRGGLIFPILLVLQFCIYYLQTDTGFLASISGYLFMVFYVVGMFVLWINRNEKGFWFIIVGVFLNFLVMLVNGGKMPVSLEAVTSALDPVYAQMLQSGTVISKHILLTDSTHLSLLGDIIPLSPPYPRSQVISIGDIIMNFGIFIYLQKVMLAQKAESSLLKQQEVHIPKNPEVKEDKLL